MPYIESTDVSLNNDRLSVQISYPEAVYKGSRFDWNGFITQVTFDGKHTFCVPEALIPGKGCGGQGLCGEFGIDEAIGYSETSIGDYFLKIGVGHLKKIDNKPYDFFKYYPVIPIISSVTVTSDKVLFQAKSTINDGYSYEYTKKIKIEGSFLIIYYSLKNTGSRKMETTEYCHNFIGINNNVVSSSYKLKISGQITLEKVVGVIRPGYGTLTWPDQEIKQEFYCIVKDFNKNSGYSWELYNSDLGVGLREIDDFEILKFAVWGSKHVISPETFVKLELEPGQTKSWMRKYEFFDCHL